MRQLDGHLSNNLEYSKISVLPFPSIYLAMLDKNSCVHSFIEMSIRWNKVSIIEEIFMWHFCKLILFENSIFIVNNVGVSWEYPEYFAEIDVEVREVFPMAHIWLILYLRNRKPFLCFHTVIETLVEVLPNFHECFYNVWQGRSQDFQRGGVDFLLKREKQGASIAYVGGFWGEAPEDIPFPWI